MLISEIYSSRQGEGRLTGQQSVFIRTSGCNLRCDFCDTPYTSWNPEGVRFSVDEICSAVEAFDTSHVVVTGGEPMLNKQIVELTTRLRATQRHITIETAGTVYYDVKCDLMSISPKLSNSTPSEGRAGEWSRKHEQARINIPVVQQLIDSFDYQLKFVVVHPDDVEEIKLFCHALRSVRNDKILLMPEGVEPGKLESREVWIQSACEEHGFTYCPRMHIRWYGNQRGT